MEVFSPLLLSLLYTFIQSNLLGTIQRNTEIRVEGTYTLPESICAYFVVVVFSNIV